MPIKSIQAKQAYEQLWTSRDTLGTTLLVLVIDSFGQEIFDMDPEAFRQELQEAFGVQDIPVLNTDKVWALWNALTTDLVHTDVPTFINAANVLNGTMLSYDIFDPADVYECAWTITELTLLDGDTPNRLSPEVRRYIGEICKEQGLYRPPVVLSNVADFGSGDYYARVEENVVDTTELQVMNNSQQDFAADIMGYVSRQTSRLMTQLNGVPLINKDSKTWTKFINNFAKEIA